MPEPVSSPAPEDLPVWDQVAATAVVGGDAGVARDLLDQLRAELPAVLATMQAHAAAGDWPAVATAAHRCAGGAAYCGVPALSAALRELERAVLEQADAAHTEAAFAQTLREVKRLLALTL